MFKHIFVPLDGSGLAESVLPAAVFMAEKFNARVTLIHIIEKNLLLRFMVSIILNMPKKLMLILKKYQNRG